MNCRRSQELMSDLVEGTLAPLLQREVETHLASCLECRELLSSLHEVITSLQSFQAPEPSEHLTELVLERSRPLLHAAREDARELMEEDPFSGPTFWRTAASWLAAAAVLAAVVVWHPPEFVETWSRRVSQTAHQTYSFGVRSYHRTERWIEELNVLRMTVEVAFENRLDRLNERLRDLEQARRKTGGEEQTDDSSRSRLVPENKPRSQILAERRRELDPVGHEGRWVPDVSPAATVGEDKNHPSAVDVDEVDFPGLEPFFLARYSRDRSEVASSESTTTRSSL